MPDLIYSAGFWMWFDFRISQSCEYTRVLHMSGLYKVLNKIFHDRCLTVFWISPGFWIWQGSKYASSSEYASVNQGFEVSSPSYMFDRALSILRVLNIPGLNIKGLWIWEGYTEFCVNCILKSVNRLLSQKVPNETLHRIYLTGFEYTTVLK